LAVLSVRGDDARVWLNGQVTNDVRTTQPGDAVHALVLNVKGRILADAIVVDRGESGLAAVVPKSELATLHEHLEKYVIMEDVTLVDETLSVAELHGGTVGESYRAPWLGEGVAIWIGDGAALASLERIDDAEAERARITQGRPAFGVDFGPTTYPQEAGLDTAVSFQKGCYLGQEVVCMLENRGQLSRRLVRLTTDRLVVPGAKVTDASGAEVGAITSAAPASEGGVALGYVKRAAIAEARPLTIDGVAAHLVS
jgi:folate-binding protein YgfZ